MYNPNKVSSAGTTTPSFEHRPNTLGVEVEGTWSYYGVRVDRETQDNFIVLVKAPPVLAHGILALAGRNYYKITPQDILRGRINVESKCPRPGSDEVIGDEGSVNEPGTCSANEASECEEFDLDVEEQREALLNSQSSEEETWKF